MRAVIVAFALVALSARAARADRWYGYKVAGADAAATGLWIAGMKLDDEPGHLAPALLVTGLVAWVVGAPIVHAAEGEHDRALLSLGGRLLVPILLFDDDGSAAHDPSYDLRKVVAVLGTWLAVEVLDLGLLAWADEPAADARRLQLTLGGTF